MIRSNSSTLKRRFKGAGKDGAIAVVIVATADIRNSRPLGEMMAGHDPHSVDLFYRDRPARFTREFGVPIGRSYKSDLAARDVCNLRNFQKKLRSNSCRLIGV